MITLLRLLLFFVGALLIVTFAVANRDAVVLEFFPLPISPQHVPVYAVFLAGLVIGSLLGAASMWLSSLPMRAEWRRSKRDLQRIENQAKQKRLREEEAAAEKSQRRKERGDSLTDDHVVITGPD